LSGPIDGYGIPVGLLTGVLSLAREPLRLTLRVWEFGLSSAASVAKVGLELLDAERYPPPPPPERRSGRTQRPVDVDVDVDVAPSAPVAQPAPPAADSPPAVPDELIPDHVDEEVVLVAELAEEGAEDGAGAELHVDEPWDGYDEMTAPEIRARLAAADPVVAAAVNLYETTHKSRRTVLEAAERALKT
jgi:hypothetical protein